jgi:peptide/nickel transport system substrate-binding protein
MAVDKHRFTSSWLTRRGFLGTAAGAAAGYGLWRALTHHAGIATTWAASDFKLQAPEPNPKFGGVLRYGIPSTPAHFDVHQSGTVNNMGTQGCMYDNLIRRDPRDSGQSIIPDLAHSWEISRDRKTYTFFLRKGVTFHDGAPFTAEDVKATYTRIIWPPRGVSIPRTPLFSTVSAINVRDAYTIEFMLHEPRPESLMLAAFATGWNVIVRKKTLEDNNYDLRRVMTYPGTGPFRHVKRVDKEVWVMEKNRDYWNEGLPYLDGIEFYHLAAFSPELGAALFARRIDYARMLDPVSLRKVKATPGMSGTDFYQSIVHAVWVNTTKKPFDDPRVRRALHLAFDRPVLVEAAKDITTNMVGGFLYPFSMFATPTTTLSERLGYHADPTGAIKEARQLLAAAGYAKGLKSMDFLIWESQLNKVWAIAIQAMLKDALQVETTLRTAQISSWFDDTQAGNFDLSIGIVVSTLMDPSDYFHAWYGKDGPQNFAKWSNKEFEELVNQIDRELDETKRKTLVSQAETIMEQDPPLLPVSWEKINDGWYDYVKGHNPYNYFGMFDVVRFDTFWLDR